MKLIVRCRLPLAWLLLASAGAHAQHDASILADTRYGVQHGQPVLKSAVFPSSLHYAKGDAQDFFHRYLPMASSDELRFKNETPVAEGIAVQRYEQYYQGIPVAHGSYTVMLKDGVAQVMQGSFYKTGAMPVAPVLSAGEAIAKAMVQCGAAKYAWQDKGMEARIRMQQKSNNATWYPSPALTYLEDFNSGEPDGKLRLAYAVDLYATEPLSHNVYYLDAVDGHVLFVNALLHHTAATGASRYSGTVGINTGHVGGGYYLHDSTRGNGIFTYDLQNGTTGATPVEYTNSSVAWPANGGIDVHWGVASAFDYWKNVRSRMSYDNLNGALYAYTNYGINYNNAFWDGTSMNFGSGFGATNGGYDPFVSLDVVAHELAHGVCQTTAGLIYNRESGALNEGFSDIWGSVVEQYADPHEADAMPKSTWEIGEELGNALRSMKSPKQHYCPDTYHGTYWMDATASCNPNTSNDNCGVHANSGVLNHWFYLVSAGDSGINDLGSVFQIAGIGMDKAATIAYTAELTLAPASDYADCRTATIYAATLLYGACSQEVEAVTRAWYGVNVGTDFTPCTPQATFVNLTASYTEAAGRDGCAASHLANIPVQMKGPALTGGNAVYNITVTENGLSTGADYHLNTPVLTFTPGGPTVQNVQLSIFDNGALDTARSLTLHLSLVAGNSNATASAVLTSTKVIIISDDVIPDPGNPGVYMADTINGYSNFTSSFAGGNAENRSQYIIRPVALIAGGIKPHVPITDIAFYVQTKNSSQPYNGYTLKMGHTATPAFAFGTGFLPGLTPLFSGSYTTVPGWNTLTLSTPFEWNGVDNIVVETCFANSAGNTSGQNDIVAGHVDTYMATAYNSSSATPSGGCALPYNGNLINVSKPTMRFTMAGTPTPIATANTAARTWNVRSGQEVYFYNFSDSNLIAALLQPDSNLGCTEAKISQAGTGFRPASFDTLYRSLKEMVIIPAQNSSTSGEVIMYVRSTELAGVAPAAISLLHTAATTDAGITSANTTIIQPQLISGSGYTGFKAHFNGVGGRYFLIANHEAPGLSTVKSNDNYIAVARNPFQDEIVLNYKLDQVNNIQVNLYDIMGKEVFKSQRAFVRGTHQVTFSGFASLPSGQYILRVLGEHIAFTAPLIKNE